MMTPKKLLVIHTKSALNSLDGKEALDLSLIFGAYEQEVTVVFYQEGVFQTLAHQVPEKIGQKDYLTAFKTLDIYDIEQVFVCQKSLEKFGLSGKELITDIEPVSHSQLLALKANADHIYII